MGIIFFWV